MLRACSNAEREALLRSRAHETWYGWQTLSVDAVAIGTLLLGAAIVTTRPPSPTPIQGTRPVAFAAVSMGLFVAGPPVVHLAHGKLVRGLASVGLRLVLPLAGFAIGYLASGPLRSGAGSTLTDGAVGGVLGGAGAMAADAAVLGWDRWYGGQWMPSALLAAGASF
jgi:hypothetical protein